MKSQPQHKICKSVLELETLLAEVRRDNCKVVFTNGCFDLLHAGHVDYLVKAANLGDFFVVALNTDRSIKALKGDKRPINALAQRLNVVAALECVDAVIAFDADTPKELIEHVKPDILVKGGDYTLETIVGSDFVLKEGGQVEIVPFVEAISTTQIIEKIQTS